VGKSKVLRTAAVVPRSDILALMALPPDSEALQIDSWDVLDDRVIGVCTQYFPLPRFAGFDRVYAELGKTHAALAHFGVKEFQRKLSRITARAPSREVAHQLGQPASVPILYVETVYVDERGDVIEYGISRFSGTAIQLVIEPDA
jgi:GntR family phosphonate transport system transcriptional regulator